MKIRIGTRKSKLALAQTKLVQEKIQEIMPDAQVEIIPILTQGDKDHSTALYNMPSTGVFVKDIEKALLNNSIDIAVHSLKDVSSVIDERLMILDPILFEDKRDCLISKDHKTLDILRKNAILATSSLRRIACIHHVRPDIQFVNIRGNIETRIQKFEDSNIDGIILAAAGLKRLGLDPLIDEYLDPKIFIPACGQGTIALEIRKEDHSRFKCLSFPSNASIEAKVEREFLKLCQAGCHYPVGCYAKFEKEHLIVYACLGKTSNDCKFIHATFKREEHAIAAKELHRKIKEEAI